MLWLMLISLLLMWSVLVFLEIKLGEWDKQVNAVRNPNPVSGKDVDGHKNKPAGGKR